MSRVLKVFKLLQTVLANLSIVGAELMSSLLLLCARGGSMSQVTDRAGQDGVGSTTTTNSRVGATESTLNA